MFYGFMCLPAKVSCSSPHPPPTPTPQPGVSSGGFIVEVLVVGLF